MLAHSGGSGSTRALQQQQQQQNNMRLGSIPDSVWSLCIISLSTPVLNGVLSRIAGFLSQAKETN